MSDLAEVMKSEPPRLVIMFRRDEGGNEQFQWGIVGNMPILSLIGYITRVQAELAFRSPQECDFSALVIAWDAEKQLMEYWVDPVIPVDSLVGMLEVAKASLVGGSVARTAPPIITPKKGGIVGPDGNPFRG